MRDGSARQQIVDHLDARLPVEWDVLPYARDLGNLTNPTVCVETTRIEQGAVAGLWQATTSVYVIAPYEDVAQAEDMLEDGIVRTLNALDEITNVNLGADRVVIADRHHAYRADLTYPLSKTDQED